MEPITITIELDAGKSERAATIACTFLGHYSATCPTPAEHVVEYAMIQVAKHVEATERQLAADAARAAVPPFGEPPTINWPGVE
ncbi:hypothetical protein GTE7_gp005 [Gordonia phage GTE7]|uniref:Uncharacterized protein n=1 Tax=Gordonia phage GTE7 TaxID=1100814 RepID=G8FRZ8_9CAUD|nr:hypothetical protein GTE7_gp005 [Gordonia phage GTE7]AER26548.1 hypothetical protein [Gordonia phage GTE7]